MCHIFTWNLFLSFWILFEVQFWSAANLMDHPDHVNGKYLPKLKMIQVLVMDFQFILNIFNMRNIKLYLTRFHISWWLGISDDTIRIYRFFTGLKEEIGRVAGFLTRLIFRKLPIHVLPYAHEIRKQQCLKSEFSSNNRILLINDKLSSLPVGPMIATPSQERWMICILEFQNRIAFTTSVHCAKIVFWTNELPNFRFFWNYEWSLAGHGGH